MTPVGASVKRIRETVRTSGPLWTASLVLDRLLPLAVLGLWRERTVSADVLHAQVVAILRAFDMPPEHVSITADHMLYADLRGIDSHGCGMLLHYHRGFTTGSFRATPAIIVERESATTALIDGGGGLGHVPGDRAMRLAVAKCLDAGVGAVAVRNSGHYGAAGAYAAIAARAGLIGVATTNTESPAVVPTLGAEAMLGTNPIAFAAPAQRNPMFLLDMATSTVPVGKLVLAARRGRAIPAGWAQDAGGKPVTSGRRAAAQRRLTPLGSRREMSSHKGYGLAAAVEILSSLLPGPRAGQEPRTHPRVGHFFLAVDPRRFRDPGEFEADLDRLIDSLRASKPLDAERPVLVAGDPERAALAERSRSGIPLSRSVVEDIRWVARATGAPFLLDPTP